MLANPPATPGDSAIHTTLLHQLGKDHLNSGAIRQLLSSEGRDPVLSGLARIAAGSTPEVTSYIQANAIYALGMIGDPAALPTLLGLLDESDPDLQVLVVRALGRIGGEQALEPVRRLYNGPPAPTDKAAPASPPIAAAPAPQCHVAPALALEMQAALRDGTVRAGTRSKRWK